MTAEEAEARAVKEMGDAAEIGREIGLDQAVGQLLPEDKLERLEQLRSHLSRKGKLLYTGDGINDTPVPRRTSASLWADWALTLPLR